MSYKLREGSLDRYKAVIKNLIEREGEVRAAFEEVSRMATKPCAPVKMKTVELVGEELPSACQPIAVAAVLARHGYKLCSPGKPCMLSGCPGVVEVEIARRTNDYDQLVRSRAQPPVERTPFEPMRSGDWRRHVRYSL